MPRNRNDDPSSRYRRGRSQANVTTRVRKTVAIVALTCLWASNAQAQQRSLINLGFEQNDPNGAGAPNFEILADTVVPGWVASTGEIELWDNNFQGVPAHSGSVFAELNANNPGTLFQNVCLLAGETLTWSFAHRARSGAANPQIVNLEVADSSGTVIQSLATQSTLLADEWQVNSGSATYSGTTGVQRIQLRTTQSGSLGNFLDSFSLDLPAFAEFQAAAYSDAESSGGNIPQIVVSGQVDAATTIPVTVTGGTADGADFTLTSGIVSIPAGTYVNQAFPIALTVTNNAVPEPDETITFSLGTPSTGEIQLGPIDCASAARQTTTYTIVNDDADIAVVKTGTVNLGADGQLRAGDTVTYNYTVSNGSNLDLLDISVVETAGTFSGSGALPTPAYVSGGSNIGGNPGIIDLPAGAGTVLFSATYTITQADINAGNLTNQAVASGTPPSGPAVTDSSDESGTGASDNDPTVVPLPAAPAMTMTKVASDDTLRAAGDVIVYTYTITNTGNVPIQNVTVSDAHNGSGPPPSPSSETLLTDTAPASDSTDAANNGSWDVLAPGDVITFTGSYTVTQADVDTLQ